MAIKIVSTGAYLPAIVRTNEEVEFTTNYSRVDRDGLSLDDWALRTHGGSVRHIADKHQATSDLATEAAINALEAVGLTGVDIDLIVLSTFTGDYQLPQTAGILQSKLNSRAKFIQIDAACSGFLDGLLIADALMSRHGYSRALIVAADILSRLCEPTDFLSRTVFGDGAGAVVVENCAKDEVGICAYSTGSDGHLGEYVCAPGGGSRHPISQQTLDEKLQYWKFQYQKIHGWALDRMMHASKQVLSTAGLTIHDIDLIVPHQASSRILAEFAAKMDYPKKQVIDIYRDIGNISGASIIVALDVARHQGRIKPGQLILMPAVGAGMAWGAIVCRWEIAALAIVPIPLVAEPSIAEFLA